MYSDGAAQWGWAMALAMMSKPGDVVGLVPQSCSASDRLQMLGVIHGIHLKPQTPCVQQRYQRVCVLQRL